MKDSKWKLIARKLAGEPDKDLPVQFDSMISDEEFRQWFRLVSKVWEQKAMSKKEDTQSADKVWGRIRGRIK